MTTPFDRAVGLPSIARGQVRAAGLDGCRAGWIAAFAFGDAVRPAGTGLRLFDDVQRVVSWSDEQAVRPVVAVDVPIGLPATGGLRECDRQARARLGRRWMCVFEVPDRDLIGHEFEAAREIVHRRREARPGEALHVPTRQTVQITDKIRDVDRILCQDPSRERWLFEVHPEVSFRELAGEDLPRKKTAAGKKHRLALLRDRFPDVEKRLCAAPWRRREVAYDDMLDAYIALWSALRFSRGTSHYIELGDGKRDDHRLLERIVV
jgi:predicted RNase H-like nuclease